MNKNLKQFKPTPEMLSSCQALTMAEAWLKTVEPIVLGYQRNILEFWRFGSREKQGRLAEIITDPKRSYLLDDKDFALYVADCEDERIKAGLKIQAEGNCPLLEAKSNLAKAKWALIEASKNIVDIDSTQLLISDLENYNKYIELTMRLIAQYLTREGNKNHENK